jgi:hypothetical protein
MTSVGIEYWFLKLRAEPEIESFHHVLKACVKHAQVPNTLTQSKTVFVFKKGEMDKPANWGHITITLSYIDCSWG